MDHEAIADAVEEAAALLRADGADLELVSAEPAAARISLQVVMESAACRECVLPPDQLRDVIGAGLARRLGEEVEVVIDDPRVPEGAA